MSYSFGQATTTSGSTFGTNTASGSLFGGGDALKTNQTNSDNKPSIFGSLSTSTPVFGGFSLGAKTTASSLFSPTTTQATTNANTAFGANKPVTFGGFMSPPVQTVGSPGFGQAKPATDKPQATFGATSQQAPAFSTATTQASVFGSPTNSSFSFGKTSGFGFNTPNSGFSAPQPAATTAQATQNTTAQQPTVGFGQSSFGSKPFSFNAATTTGAGGTSFPPTALPSFSFAQSNQPTTTQQQPSFGSAFTTQQSTFGTTPSAGQQQQSFGTQAPTFGQTAQVPSYGSPQTSQALNFGNVQTSQPSAFGANQTPAFGTTPTTQAAFGTTTTTQSAYGTTPATLAFGSTSTSQPAFGTTPPTQTTFGTTPTTQLSFGTTPTTQSAFGITPSSKTGFGVPATQSSFGTTSTVPPTFGKTTTQASFSTTSTAPPSFGTTTTPQASLGTTTQFGTTTTSSFAIKPTTTTLTQTSQALNFPKPQTSQSNFPVPNLSSGTTQPTFGQTSQAFGTTSQTTQATTTTSQAGFGFGKTTSSGLSFSTTSTLSFGKPTLTTATTTSTSTTAPSGITSLSKSTAPTMTTATSSAITTGPPAAITSMTFAQLEEGINKWTLDLEEQESSFINQATQINAWDRLLVANGEKILELNEAVESVKNEQQSLEHELDFVLAQQKELEDLLLPLDKQLLKDSNDAMRDPEREHMYTLAETLDTQLRQMSEDLKEVIEHLNETNRSQDNNDPIVQIGRILNAHMSSMQWIDGSIAQISTKLDQLKTTHDTLRRDNERSFQLTYN